MRTCFVRRMKTPETAIIATPVATRRNHTHRFFDQHSTHHADHTTLGTRSCTRSSHQMHNLKRFLWRCVQAVRKCLFAKTQLAFFFVAPHQAVAGAGSSLASTTSDALQWRTNNPSHGILFINGNGCARGERVRERGDRERTKSIC